MGSNSYIAMSGVFSMSDGRAFRNAIQVNPPINDFPHAPCAAKGYKNAAPGFALASLAADE